jgi:hypothetical protein
MFLLPTCISKFDSTQDIRKNARELNSDSATSHMTEYAIPIQNVPRLALFSPLNTSEEKSMAKFG